MAELIAEASLSRRARIAGLLYLLYVLPLVILDEFIQRLVVDGDAVATAKNILTHQPPLWLAVVFPAAALACGIAATALLYALFKPVNRSISLAAAFFNLAALTLPITGAGGDSLFRGCFCLMVGYLVFRSMFLPRVLAAFMVVAGLGWLASVPAWLARHLSHHIWDGIVLAELSLSVWLLVMSVNVQGWRDQVNAAENLHRS